MYILGSGKGAQRKIVYLSGKHTFPEIPVMTINDVQ